MRPRPPGLARAGYGTAFLLWPASDVWAEGEVDYPEMGWGGQIKGYVHKIGDPSVNAAIIDTTVTTSGWHMATIEWLPTALRFWGVPSPSLWTAGRP